MPITKKESTATLPIDPRKPTTPQPRSFWKKLGGGSLSLSLLFHGILVLIGAIWILKIIPNEPEKVVDFMPRSGGGGSPASEMKAQKQRVQMSKPNMNRVAALDVASDLVLADPEESSPMTSLSSLGSSGLSGGLGGSGSGGGKGDGKGLGIGSGLAAGLSNGGGFKNPFGLSLGGSSGLTGRFYDYKRDSDGKPSSDAANSAELTENYRKVIDDFTKGMVWGPPRTKKSYLSPTKLVAKAFAFPGIPDTDAGKAFNSPESKPGMWVAHYSGETTFIGSSGRYRLIGWGDNCLVVGFNNKVVLDASDKGYTGKKRDSMGSTHVKGKPSASLFRGDWVTLRTGQRVRIDVLIGDEGGIFSAAAFLEKDGEPEFAGGAIPPLPVLRVAPFTEEETAIYNFLPDKCLQDPPLFEAKAAAF